MPIRRLRPILLFSLIVLFIVPVYAQDDVKLPADRAVITPENVAQLQPLGRYGTGELSDAFAWTPDESTLAIGGATGIWLYASDTLTTPFDFIPTDQYVKRLWFSPDAQYLAYQTYHDRLYLLDYATRSEIEIFEDAQTIAFHPEGVYLIVGLTRLAMNGEEVPTLPVSAVLLWDMRKRETLKTLEVARSNWDGSFVNMDFSADGTLFVAAWRSGDYSTCGDHDSLVRWWEFDDILNHSEQELKDDAGSIGRTISSLYDAKFHPTQNIFASILTENLLLGLSDTLVIHDPLNHQTTHYDLGDRVTAYTQNGTTTYSETITGFDFSSRSYDGETDMGTIDVVVKRPMDTGDAIHTVEIADGTTLQKLTFDGRISAYAAAPQMTVAMNGRYFINDSTGELTRIGASGMSRFSESNNAMNHAVNDDGSAFLSRNFDGLWRLWRLNEADRVEEISLPPEYRTWTPGFIPGGKIIKFDAAEDQRRFALWDFETGTSFEIDAANVYDDWNEVDFSPNGERMAIQRRNGQIEIYNTSSGILLSTLDAAFDRRTQLVFSPDGAQLTTAHFVATGDLNTSTIEIREWTSETGELHRDYGTFASSATYGEVNMGQTQVRYSADGARLSLQSTYVRTIEGDALNFDRFVMIRVLDVTTGDTLFFHSVAEERMTSTWGLFSDDLQLLALNSSVHSSMQVELVEVSRNALIGGDKPSIYIGWSGGPTRFSPDNKRLVMHVASSAGCGDDTKQVLLHDVETLAEVAHISAIDDVLDYAPQSMKFSPDSRMLMFSGDATATFYDAQTGELITTIDGLDNSRLHFSADGTLLIAARDDGTVTLWGIPADNAD